VSRHELLETAPAWVGGARIAFGNVGPRPFARAGGGQESVESAVLFVLEPDGTKPALLRLGDAVTLPNGSYALVEINHPPEGGRATLWLDGPG